MGCCLWGCTESDVTEVTWRRWRRLHKYTQAYPHTLLSSEDNLIRVRRLHRPETHVFLDVSINVLERLCPDLAET